MLFLCPAVLCTLIQVPNAWRVILRDDLEDGVDPEKDSNDSNVMDYSTVPDWRLRGNGYHMSSYLYSWHAPFMYAAGLAMKDKSCRCGQNCPMNCWHAPKLENFVLHYNLICTQLNFPIYAGVAGAGVLGSSVQGSPLSPGYRAFNVLGGAIRIRLVPLSIVVSFVGTFEVASDNITATPMRYFYLLRTETASWKDNSEKVLGHVRTAQRRLHSLDETFAESIEDCPPCSNRCSGHPWPSRTAKTFEGGWTVCDEACSIHSA